MNDEVLEQFREKVNQACTLYNSTHENKIENIEDYYHLIKIDGNVFLQFTKKQPEMPYRIRETMNDLYDWTF